MVFEKNKEIGGRARQFSDAGFTFDMGPSWYWMPEVFERYYHEYGHTHSDFYELKKLDPAFRIFFSGNQVMDVAGDYERLRAGFEEIEPGAADKLDKFMEGAQYKYELGMESLVLKPGLSLFEFADARLISGLFKLQVFSSFRKHVRSYFKDERLVALMEFPVLFLGASPQKTPALYSLMNYAGLKLGTWYPMGGFGKVIDAFKQIADEQGVTFYPDEPVTGVEFTGDKIVHVKANGHSTDVDAMIASADYHHIDQHLLPEAYRAYDRSYWESRTMAPSCLIFYLGVNKKLKGLRHHNLFFDESLDEHAREIYDDPSWPAEPLFYVCCPSVTDESVAPEGKENLFILMPLAPGLEDTEELRQRYFRKLMRRLETLTDQVIEDHLGVKRSYCINDFVQDYNAFKGNAYGLANTLKQTANLKPRIRSKKVSNLFYSGQLTVPGPGVPPSIISGQVSADQLSKYFKSN